MNPAILMTTAWLLAGPAAAGEAAGAGRVPEPAVPGSAAAIREHTTDPRYLPPRVAYVPWSDGVPSPADILGHLPGARGRLARSADLDRYLEALAGASDRVQTFRVGRTAEGRDLRVAVIGSAENIRRLVAIQNDLLRLGDPRQTDRETARALAADLPLVVGVSAGLGAADLAGPEMLAELAHRLTVSGTDAIRLVRENTLVVVLPAADPDARDKTVDWFHRHLEGRTSAAGLPPTAPPYWGEHAREDGVRDVVLVTTRKAAALLDLYFRFRPALMIDIGAAPYPVDARGALLPAPENAVRVDRPVTGPGPAWIASAHGGRGIRITTLSTGTAETLSAPGGAAAWSLRDAVNLTQDAVLDELDRVARRRESLLMDTWRRAADAVRRGARSAPHAWLVPRDQDDPWRRALLVSVLVNQGIEVDLLASSWQEDGTVHPAGSQVVRADQPYRELARGLLSPEPVKDPIFAGLPAGGRLATLLGVDVRAIGTPGVLEAPLEPVLGLSIPYPGRMVGDGPVFVLPDRGQAGFYELVTRLRAKKLRMSMARRSFDIPAPAEEAGEHGAIPCPPGSLIVEFAGGSPADLRRTLEFHTLGLGLTAYGLPSAPDVPGLPVRVPRLAVYESWASTRESGWYRYAFGRSRLVHATLHDADLRAGGLRDRHDVILLPDLPGAFRDLVHGIDERHGDLAFTGTEAYPSHGLPFEADKTSGGMGLEGLAHLFEFVRDGGVLVAVENAGTLVVDGGLVRDVTRVPGGRMTGAREVPVVFSRPAHPISFGYGESTTVLRSSGPLWDLVPGGRGDVVVTYGDVPGGGDLTGRPAVIDAQVGRGRVVLYTFNPVERYLNHSDFRLLYNAILHEPTLAAGGGALDPIVAERPASYGKVPGFADVSRRGSDDVHSPETDIERP